MGTTLFNMVVHPTTGAVYVSNTESRNDLRFEGPGTFAGTTLRGHLAESRITVLSGGTVAPRYLNKHIPYGVSPTPPIVKQHSLATPLEMVLSADGSTLYVAAFGSGKVGVFPVSALEDDSFDPTQLSANYLAVSGGGPSGLVLDEARSRLYVATRFDNGVSAVDLGTRQESAHLLLATPESKAIIAGRRFLCDATMSSSNGEASCASCHIFGNTDHLAWDLGNPDGDVVITPIHIKLGQGGAGTKINGSGDITVLRNRASAAFTSKMLGGRVTECELVARGVVNGRATTFAMRADGSFGRDDGAPAVSDAELRQLAQGARQQLTYTCLPPGWVPHL